MSSRPPTTAVAREPAWPRPAWIPAAMVVALALALRARSFHPYADDWDPCEYVWAVEGGYLPHSPYVLYLWIGRLLSIVAPTDVALSLLSLVSGTLAVVFLIVLVRRQCSNAVAPLVAGTAYAVFPSAVWNSAIQEVYAPAVAFGLAAFLYAGSRGRARSLLGGALFGCALATHSGIVFLAPAFGLALLGHGAPGPVERNRGSVLLAAVGALLVPAAAVAWVAVELPPRANLWRYLAGIAPIETSRGAGSLEALARTAEGSLEHTVGTGFAVLLLVLCACLTLVRRPSAGVFWIVWAAPYLLYESAIGYNVDPGVHMAFGGPAIAALLGHGLAAGAAWAGASAQPMLRAAARGFIVLGIAALLPSAWSSFRLGQGLLSRAAYLSSEPVASLIEARSMTPPDAVLVQPAATDNVNLGPAYSARRPIIREQGGVLFFDGSPGSPLNRTSFVPVTPQLLDRLLREGTPIVSLGPDPAPLGSAVFRWRAEGPLFVLERAVQSE